MSRKTRERLATDHTCLRCVLGLVVTLVYIFKHWKTAKHRASVHTSRGKSYPIGRYHSLIPITGPVNRDYTRAVMAGYHLFDWLFTSVTFLHTIDNGVHSIDTLVDPGSR